MKTNNPYIIDVNEHLYEEIPAEERVSKEKTDPVKAKTKNIAKEKDVDDREIRRLLNSNHDETIECNAAMLKDEEKSAQSKKHTPGTKSPLVKSQSKQEKAWKSPFRKKDRVSDISLNSKMMCQAARAKRDNLNEKIESKAKQYKVQAQEELQLEVQSFLGHSHKGGEN